MCFDAAEDDSSFIMLRSVGSSQLLHRQDEWPTNGAGLNR